MKKQFSIRLIQKKDNGQVAALIRKVFEDMGIPKTGTAYSDPYLDDMFTAYQKPRTAYYVVVEEDKVIGGAGVAPLDNFDGNVCELQKMYFLEEARGKGVGSKMLDICLKKAREFEFESCYLETMPYMEAAQKLYKKYGFEYIESAMGCTGHSACPVYMLKTL